MENTDLISDLSRLQPGYWLEYTDKRGACIYSGPFQTRENADQWRRQQYARGESDWPMIAEVTTPGTAAALYP